MELDAFLVPVDSTKIRKKAMKELNTTMKKIESAKSNIHQYYHESKPEFQKWYENSCAALIHKINQLEEKYRKKELEVQEVFAYSEFYRIPPAVAYARIQERKNTPEEEREFDPFYDSSQMPDEEEEDPRDTWEDDFRSRQHSHYSHRFDTHPHDNHSQEFLEECSIIFHRVANLLHPDKNPNQKPEEKERWLEALKYYKEKNLTALKNILTWLYIFRQDPNQEVTVSEIHSLNQKMKSELKSLQKKIRQYKKSLDWEFHKKSPKEKQEIQKQLEETLQTDYILIHIKMEKLDEVIYSWKEYLKFLNRTHPYYR